MQKFKTFFSAARKRCLPDWESRAVRRQGQAQRLRAAEIAYDKIIDQVADTVCALRGQHAVRTGTSTGNSRQWITGEARDTMLRKGELTLDLGRQLALHALLPASDNPTLQLATTYDIDAVHALESDGLLRADQRGLLNGLSAVVYALTQLPSALKQPGTTAGNKFAQANIALGHLVERQKAAHATLTKISLLLDLSLEDRAVIFNDRSVALLMELTAGRPENQHDLICWRMVVEARQMLRDPQSTSMC